GTDRFTTVYPNLNLFKNTKSQSYTSTGTAENISSNIYPLDGNVADILNKPITITYDYTITNSSGTWSGSIRPTYGLGGTNQSVSSTKLSGTCKETVTLTAVSHSSYGILTSGLPTGAKVTITNLKVEFGSTATPWMPSATEVTTADWPKYVGTYVDTNPVSSTDPSKYGWDEMKYRVYLDGIAVAGSKLLSTKVENLKPDTSYTIQVKQVSG
ncbi:fibronectin type III domain-containing protein, partial [Lactococcus petauri]